MVVQGSRWAFDGGMEESLWSMGKVNRQQWTNAKEGIQPRTVI